LYGVDRQGGGLDRTAQTIREGSFHSSAGETQPQSVQESEATPRPVALLHGMDRDGGYAVSVFAVVAVFVLIIVLIVVVFAVVVMIVVIDAEKYSILRQRHPERNRKWVAAH
jgi:hypothetical protein